MLIIKNSYEKLKVYDYILKNFVNREKENVVVLLKNLSSLYFVYMYLRMNFPEFNYIPIHASQSMTKTKTGKYKDSLKADLIDWLSSKADKYFTDDILDETISKIHDVKTKFRDDDLDICKNSEGNVILAIGKTIDTGVDVDNLHVAILGQDVASEQTLIQGVGRIVRPQEGKLAKYFDICDDFSYIGSRGGHNKNSAFQHKEERIGHYKKHGYEIKELTLNIDDI